MSKTVTRRRALTVEMTSGSLWKNILLFSLPLMMTQVLEVLFNLSDVAIAGKYAYNTYIALGAVGSTTTLVSLFTGLLIGVGAGVNVAAARGLGMEDNDNVEKTVHSSFLICLGLGVLVCLVCVFFAEPMLRLLNTKEEFLPGAVLYLKLYAIGLPGMGLYNCGNGILSATGDTKRPLVYLFIAGVLNVVLNLVSSAATCPPRAWPSPAPSPSGCPPFSSSSTCCGGRTPAGWTCASCGCTPWQPSGC